MHLYSFLFIAALLAFGGIAAYLGDILGYRLGKRRLSLLRLRPRTTARLVGILAGILIPAVTVLVGYWQVDYVRIALVELDDLRRDLDRLHHESETMQEQRDALREQLKGARREVNAARREADESRNELDGVRSNLKAAKGNLENARAQVNRLRTDKGRVEGDLRAAEEGLEAAERSLTEAGTRLEEAEASLDEAEGERDDLYRDIASLRERHKTLRDKVRALGEEWERDRNWLAGTPAVFDLGSELVRGVVRPADNLDGLKNEIVALLVLADQAAEAGGAAIGDNDRYVRAVGPAPAEALTDDQRWPLESRVLGTIVGQLWDARQASHVVRVIVARRTFSGEQVHVVFVTQPNRLVFRKGETVVSRQIPGNQDQIDVFEQLWLLITDPARSEVRKQARSAGLLPDPQTGRYGEVQIRELYRAAEACAGRPAPNTVRVEAAEDTYTAGPLSIRIVVEPSGGGGG